MPTIELTRDEARNGDLPAVCLVCGESGGVFKGKVLHRLPWWVYLGIPLLPVMFYLLPLLLLLPRARVRTPFCIRHGYHWSWRSAIIYGWPGMSISLFMVGIILTSVIESARASSNSQSGLNGLRPLAAVTVMSGFLGLMVWPFLALWLKYSGVYASRISAQSITLSGVSSEFVEALRVHRQDRQLEADRTTAPDQTPSRAQP